MNKSLGILRRNNFCYNYFLNKKILEMKGALAHEELLERIACLAKFSWRNHPGYYCDGRIENILLDLGRNLEKHVNGKSLDKDGRWIPSKRKSGTILHVATELGEVGGHTRVLYQFLRRCRDKNHIVVLTDQRADDVPHWFVNGIGANVNLITLDSTASLLGRAYLLRQISHSSEKIILYHHPYDVVPVIAFSCETGTPVLVENHAHSWFWLGPSVADLIFTHTAFHKEFTLKTRPAKNVYCLPLPMIDDVDMAFNREGKVKAKLRLNINPDNICIITVGTFEKFIPNAHYDFFKTAEKITERFTNAEVFIIGLPEDQRIRDAYNPDSQKIHFLGPINDPSDYYKAADLYLEALPQPSLGATMFSTVIGLSCPLLKYGDTHVFNSNNFIESELYEKHIGNSKNEKEYLDKLELLINNPELRYEISHEIRERYLRQSSDDKIAEDIEEMLELTNNMPHVPRKIEEGSYHTDSDSAEIASASALQGLHGVMSHFEKYLSMRDKMNIMAGLCARLIHPVDVFGVARALSRKKMRSKWSGVSKNMRSLCRG